MPILFLPLSDDHKYVRLGQLHRDNTPERDEFLGRQTDVVPTPSAGTDSQSRTRALLAPLPHSRDHPATLQGPLGQAPARHRRKRQAGSASKRKEGATRLNASAKTGRTRERRPHTVAYRSQLPATRSRSSRQTLSITYLSLPLARRDHNPQTSRSRRGTKNRLLYICWRGWLHEVQAEMSKEGVIEDIDRVRHAYYVARWIHTTTPESRLPGQKMPALYHISFGGEARTQFGLGNLETEGVGAQRGAHCCFASDKYGVAGKRRCSVRTAKFGGHLKKTRRQEANAATRREETRESTRPRRAPRQAREE